MRKTKVGQQELQADVELGLSSRVIYSPIYPQCLCFLYYFHNQVVNVRSQTQ